MGDYMKKDLSLNKFVRGFSTNRKYPFNSSN